MSEITGITSYNKDKGVSPRKSFADTKRWLSNEFYQALNRHTVTNDGDMITNAQAMVNGIIDMAVNPEKDDYVRLAASKFIIEHMEGKASAMTDEKHEDIPQIVINVKNMNMSNIQNNIAQLSESVPSSDVIDEMGIQYSEDDL